jgi:hypothetical protein
VEAQKVSRHNADSAASTEMTLARKMSNATSIAAYATSTGRSPKKEKNSYRYSAGVISLTLARGGFS